VVPPAAFLLLGSFQPAIAALTLFAVDPVVATVLGGGVDDAGDMTAVYCSDGDTYPSRGARGGSDGAPSINQKQLADGTLKTLPSFHEEICAPGEMFRFVTTAGGGYGDPLQRDPEAVARTVNRGWLSKETAEAAYNVALQLTADGISYRVDVGETARRRNEAGA